MRENGWYWVLLSESTSRRAAKWKWEAARVEGDKWFIPGSAIHLPDGVIHTVGPRIPTPDESAMVACACGDQFPKNSYGAGFMAANGGVCENCDAAEGGGDGS